MSAERLSREVAALYDNNSANIIAMLQEIQSRNKNHYLPRPELEALASCLEIPVAKVYRIATFFKAFNLEPKGEYMVSLCVGTACHVRGAAKILTALEGELGVADGGTTSDLKFSIETVNCVGACALGPIAVVNEEYFGELTTDKLPEILNRFK